MLTKMAAREVGEKYGDEGTITMLNSTTTDPVSEVVVVGVVVVVGAVDAAVVGAGVVAVG